MVRVGVPFSVEVSMITFDGDEETLSIGPFVVVVVFADSVVIGECVRVCACAMGPLSAGAVNAVSS